MDYGIGSNVNAEQTAGIASNLRAGGNPAYTTSTFLAMYPQFGTPSAQGSTPNVPTAIVQLYIDLAQSSVKQSRWRGAWELAMGFFVAHFCTTWMRASASVNSGKDAIAAAGNVQGITTSESVDGVSYSMDIAAITGDLDGFASWKSTEFGIQLASMAKMYGKGGMMV